MSTTPEQLVTQIRTATDYQINKKILQEKIESDLHIAYNNGLFKVTIELIAFLTTWAGDTMYIPDVYKNPIEVDREEFKRICCQHYQMVMNNWHIQHEELKRVRKI